MTGVQVLASSPAALAGDLARHLRRVREDEWRRFPSLRQKEQEGSGVHLEASPKVVVHLVGRGAGSRQVGLGLSFLMQRLIQEKLSNDILAYPLCCSCLYIMPSFLSFHIHFAVFYTLCCLIHYVVFMYVILSHIHYALIQFSYTLCSLHIHYAILSNTLCCLLMYIMLSLQILYALFIYIMLSPYVLCSFPIHYAVFSYTLCCLFIYIMFFSSTLSCLFVYIMPSFRIHYAIFSYAFCYPVKYIRLSSNTFVVFSYKC